VFKDGQSRDRTADSIIGVNQRLASEVIDLNGTQLIILPVRDIRQCVNLISGTLPFK